MESRVGHQYFYHLVTDASAQVPAVLEKGVYAPRLAKIPAFGKSLPGEKSVASEDVVEIWSP